LTESFSGLTLREKALIAEYAESAAWSDYLSSAPPPYAQQFNLRVNEIGGAVMLCAPGINDPFYNRVVGIGVKEPATPQYLDQILDFYRQHDVSQLYLQVCPAVYPTDTLSWIEERGFYPIGSWVKLVRGREMPPYIETGLDIQNIAPSRASEFAEIIIEVFGVSDDLYPFLVNIVGRTNWNVYIAYSEGFPIAAAAMYSINDIAWLGFMATRESHRGRGAQNALITRRVFDAIESGCTWIVSDTLEHSPDGQNRSLRNLEKLGFEIAYWRINFVNF
jgi:hypothetical protein